MAFCGGFVLWFYAASSDSLYMAGFINVCVCVVAWAVDSEAANGGCPNCLLICLSTPHNMNSMLCQECMSENKPYLCKHATGSL